MREIIDIAVTVLVTVVMFVFMVQAFRACSRVIEVCDLLLAEERGRSQEEQEEVPTPYHFWSSP